VSAIRRLYLGTSPLGTTHGMRIRSGGSLRHHPHTTTTLTCRPSDRNVPPGTTITLARRSFLTDHTRGVEPPWRPLVKGMDTSVKTWRVPHRDNE